MAVYVIRLCSPCVVGLRRLFGLSPAPEAASCALIQPLLPRTCVPVLLLVEALHDLRILHRDLKCRELTQMPGSFEFGACASPLTY